VKLVALVAVPLALFLGMLAALYRNTLFDRMINVVTLTAISSPEFFIAYILVLFLVANAHLFPALSTVDQDTSFSPSSGLVGAEVTINGVGLMHSTQVTFGGVKATTFTVDSDTQVTADVPTGAKTGKIGITTKGGKASSKTSFTVN